MAKHCTLNKWREQFRSPLKVKHSTCSVNKIFFFFSFFIVDNIKFTYLSEGGSRGNIES